VSSAPGGACAPAGKAPRDGNSTPPRSRGTLRGMARWLGWGAFAALLLVVAAFVPVGGRTLAERWRTAPAPGAFLERSWREASAGWDRLWDGARDRRSAPIRAAAKGSSSGLPAAGPAPAARGGPSAPAPRPRENHTEADRAALERLVAERAR
jgi:hypothetical protein